MKTIWLNTNSGEDAGETIWSMPVARLLFVRDVKVAGGDLEEVTLTAILKEHDGFVYLEIPDEIIDGFLKLIATKGVDHPEVVSDKGYVGAHVSVMYPEEYEQAKKKKKRVSEIGDEFDFTLDKMFTTEPEGWDDVRQVYFVSIKSPQLELLRRKYGLSKLLNGHDFHVTVAVKPKRKK